MSPEVLHEIQILLIVYRPVCTCPMSPYGSSKYLLSFIWLAKIVFFLKLGQKIPPKIWILIALKGD